MTRGKLRIPFAFVNRKENDGRVSTYQFWSQTADSQRDEEAYLVWVYHHEYVRLDLIIEIKKFGIKYEI